MVETRARELELAQLKLDEARLMVEQESGDPDKARAATQAARQHFAAAEDVARRRHAMEVRTLRQSKELDSTIISRDTAHSIEARAQATLASEEQSDAAFTEARREREDAEKRLVAAEAALRSANADANGLDLETVQRELRDAFDQTQKQRDQAIAALASAEADTHRHIAEASAREHELERRGHGAVERCQEKHRSANADAGQRKHSDRKWPKLKVHSARSKARRTDGESNRTEMPVEGTYMESCASPLAADADWRLHENEMRACELELAKLRQQHARLYEEAAEGDRGQAQSPPKPKRVKKELRTPRHLASAEDQEAEVAQRKLEDALNKASRERELAEERLAAAEVAVKTASGGNSLDFEAAQQELQEAFEQARRHRENVGNILASAEAESRRRSPGAPGHETDLPGARGGFETQKMHEQRGGNLGRALQGRKSWKQEADAAQHRLDTALDKARQERILAEEQVAAAEATLKTATAQESTEDLLAAQHAFQEAFEQARRHREHADAIVAAAEAESRRHMAETRARELELAEEKLAEARRMVEVEVGDPQKAQEATEAARQHFAAAEDVARRSHVMEVRALRQSTESESHVDSRDTVAGVHARAQSASLAEKQSDAAFREAQREREDAEKRLAVAEAALRSANADTNGLDLEAVQRELRDAFEETKKQRDQSKAVLAAAEADTRRNVAEASAREVELERVGRRAIQRHDENRIAANALEARINIDEGKHARSTAIAKMTKERTCWRQEADAAQERLEAALNQAKQERSAAELRIAAAEENLKSTTAQDNDLVVEAAQRELQKAFEEARRHREHANAIVAAAEAESRRHMAETRARELELAQLKLDEARRMVDQDITSTDKAKVATEAARQHFAAAEDVARRKHEMEIRVARQGAVSGAKAGNVEKRSNAALKDARRERKEAEKQLAAAEAALKSSVADTNGCDLEAVQRGLREAFEQTQKHRDQAKAVLAAAEADTRRELAELTGVKSRRAGKRRADTDHNGLVSALEKAVCERKVADGRIAMAEKALQECGLAMTTPQVEVTKEEEALRQALECARRQREEAHRLVVEAEASFQIINAEDVQQALAEKQYRRETRGGRAPGIPLDGSAAGQDARPGAEPRPDVVSAEGEPRKRGHAGKFVAKAEPEALTKSTDPKRKKAASVKLEKIEKMKRERDDDEQQIASGEFRVGLQDAHFETNDAVPKAKKSKRNAFAQSTPKKTESETIGSPAGDIAQETLQALKVEQTSEATRDTKEEARRERKRTAAAMLDSSAEHDSVAVEGGSVASALVVAVTDHHAEVDGLSSSSTSRAVAASARRHARAVAGSSHEAGNLAHGLAQAVAGDEEPRTPTSRNANGGIITAPGSAALAMTVAISAASASVTSRQAAAVKNAASQSSATRKRLGTSAKIEPNDQLVAEKANPVDVMCEAVVASEPGDELSQAEPLPSQPGQSMNPSSSRKTNGATAMSAPSNQLVEFSTSFATQQVVVASNTAVASKSRVRLATGDGFLPLPPPPLPHAEAAAMAAAAPWLPVAGTSQAQSGPPTPSGSGKKQRQGGTDKEMFSEYKDLVIEASLKSKASDSQLHRRHTAEEPEREPPLGADAEGDTQLPSEGRPCFACTGLEFTEAQQLGVSKFGAIAVGAWAPNITHLVADTFRRTLKLMCAICRGVPIVLPEYIDACQKAGALVDETPYLLRDSVCENAFARKRGIAGGFSIVGASERVKKRGLLLRGVSVYCFPSVTERRELPALVSAAGGAWLAKFPANVGNNVLLLAEATATSDRERHRRQEHEVYDVELLREAACTQRLRKSTYRLR
eukprot:TRINITY_DN5637_c0_g1_i1.p1 TRINITY_DN5637_c0_g1~~TRINITY_DN5637_c0_g1_i1.p1  ORF type:complete len:1960 (+),score=426.50 TRINITY_DN5637_c0_g1_i1:437-5881(+)